MERKCILTSLAAEMKMRRIAFQILEQNSKAQNLVLAGIKENGVVFAELLQRELKLSSNLKTEIIEININKKHPSDVYVSNPEIVKGQNVILIDDVVNSGKTFSYALMPLLQFEPAQIQAFALVERSHKTFPVHVNYVGISLATTFEEHITVEVENNKIIGAFIETMI